MSLRGENLDRGQYPFQPIHIREFGTSQSLWDRALVNEDTLLLTLCCPWCFLGCTNWETFVADAKCFWTKSETFFVSRTQNLCPQQMLRARGNNVSWFARAIVNRGEWLWNSSKFFVVCYCSDFRPWPCTKHNSCLLRTEELTNGNVLVTQFMHSVWAQNKRLCRVVDLPT